ncbi:hypothetical protein Pla52n_08860 [Stieleria varia]|uniref:Uncharacterized protein n=1 Tax=Stieleria varia TaxID=2528005 RepID=A0A5C6BCY5_9BACT|nr:hypothetical protein Pla52n_08860 [Stieleria varia]
MENRSDSVNTYQAERPNGATIMSSNRESHPCNASLHREQRVVGPIRLPRSAPAVFIESFNQIYGSMGIVVLPHEDDSKVVESVRELPQ